MKPSVHTASEPVELLPCPFCGAAVHIRKGVNGYGHCKTEGCHASRAQIVSLDDQKQVAAWNRRALTAAPVREEGGAVLDAQTVTLEWAKVETTAREEWRAEFGDYAARVVLGHDNVWSYRVNNCGHLGFASADEAKAQALSALRKRLSARLNDARATVALYDAALATREEAPAEAGEYFRAQVVKLLDELIAHIVAIGPEKPDLNTPMSRRVWREVFADLITALRAQPQAREEAQPVGRIVSCFASGLGEMRSVEWASGHAPDVGTDLYTTPPAPEAEKLREAEEALEPFAAIAGRYLAGGMRADLDARAPSLIDLFNPRDFYRAHKALAALQQEGR